MQSLIQLSWATSRIVGAEVLNLTAEGEILLIQFAGDSV